MLVILRNEVSILKDNVATVIDVKYRLLANVSKHAVIVALTLRSASHAITVGVYQVS